MRAGRNRRLAGCLAVLLAWLGALCASAAEADIAVELKKDYENAVFQVQWENSDQPARVEVRSPDGDAFSEALTPERVSEDAGMALIRVGAAKAGTWTVHVEGEGLGKVSVHGGELPGKLDIRSFTVEREGDAYRAAWSVEDCPERLSLEIYADTDAQGYDGTRVAGFTADASGEREISLSALDSGSYFFYLRVGAGELFSRAYADGAVDYVAGGAAPALAGVRARMLDDSVFLTWDPAEQDRYRVCFYDGAGGLIWQEEIQGETNYLWTPPQGLANAHASVAAVQSGRAGRAEKTALALQNPVAAQVQFPQQEATNVPYMTVQVQFEGEKSVYAACNGSPALKDVARPGAYQVPLEEGDNRVVLLISDAADNIRSFEKQIYVDTTPPALSIQKDLHHTATTEKAVYLSGYSEQGASLTLNGEAAEMVGDFFHLRCDLKPGENTFTLQAQDIAGNVSLYTAEIRRSLVGAPLFWWAMAGAVFLVLAAIYGALYWRLARRR